MTPGTVLTAEKSNGREFFIIVEGTAVVYHGGKPVATLGPDRYFGELSLLDRRSRSATVTAETEMRLLVLGQRQFNGVLDAVPVMTRKLLAVTATRLRESDERAYPLRTHPYPGVPPRRAHRLPGRRGPTPRPVPGHHPVAGFARRAMPGCAGGCRDGRR